jgi:SAM-dependent methyltransferase
VSKRDDDSQADMEVGMTTAERRRRRRRGGLRVPSDNVPRRQSTPPVVAPVPEDPALSISLAFSFAAESSEPMPHAPRESAPSFANHESVPTVIDPVSDPAIDPGMASVIDSVSGPIEQADFEMKTREMSAVDLEELGLDELAAVGATLPFQRMSIAAIESRTTTLPDLEMPFQRQNTDVADDVEVDLDPSLDGAMTLDQDLLSGERRPETLSGEIELDGGEPTTIHPGPPGPPVPPSEFAARAQDSAHPRPVAAATESSQPHPRPPMGGDGSQPRTMSGELRSGPTAPVGPAAPPAPAASPPSGGGYRLSRAQTVALSEDDLEEVREQARISGQHQPPAPVHPPSIIPPPPPMPLPARPISTSIPPPMPPMRMTKPRLAVPALPELDPPHHEDSVVVDAPTEFEVDVDGFVDSRPVAVPPAEAAHPEARPVAPPPSAAPPPPPSAVSSLGALGTLGPLSSLSAVTSLGALSASPPAAAPAMAPAAAPSPAASLVPHMPSPSMAAQQSQASQAIPPVAPPSAPVLLQPRDSQPVAALRDGHAAPPPPPPVVHKAPPAPPPAPPAPPPAAKKAAVAPLAKSELSSGRDNRDSRDARADAKPPRGKPWFVELFDEDYLRTLPFLTPQATQAEAEFVIDALGLTPGAQVLDVGCGYGRHAMELAARGFHIVGLDMSTPLLVRGGEEAHRRGLTINFVRGDMRELDFESQFDGAYCLFSTFGYFDDETNKKTVANMARALRPGGRLLIEILNRDYVIADLPTRVWWEGDGCVVLEEVELNYFSSRIQVNRSVVFDDGRQLEQEISVRAYSLHEVGKLMHSAGLRVLEVSGAYHTRTRFFGNQSRHIIVLAERKDLGVA